MKIAFTGGGTAGHAMVNTILIPFLQEMDCSIIYLGSHNGMEKKMAECLPSVKYYGISTGKLRRYFSKENFKDVFRTVSGCFEAYKILKAERPQLLYSGGGYVSVPAVLAAKSLNIPILIRETDMSVGLANRLCLPFAQKVFTAFPDTQTALPAKKASGYPGILIRPSLYDFSPLPCMIRTGKPLCLIMGGSTGAQKINEAVWKSLDYLTAYYDLIHICGKGNLNTKAACGGVYLQFEFVQDSIGGLLNAADVIVTRCGSNAMLETLALGKRAVCIPISSKSTRGEQQQNAAFAAAHSNAVILEESSLSGSALYNAIQNVLHLNNDTPYQLTQDQLLDNIHTHTAEIFTIGLKKTKDVTTPEPEIPRIS